MKIKCEKLKLNIQLFAQSDAEVKFKVVLDDSNANNQLDDLNKKGKNANTTISKIGSIGKTAFKGLATGITLAGTAMTGLLTYGVKYNATIEQLQTSFEVMTGSADKATEIVEKLKKVGAETPYELSGLAETVQLLMQYGMDADQAYESTLQLGDIAQGSAEKMSGIALALGQMSSYGKVTLVDIKQMITNGFNPLQEISESTGESMESLYDRISKGTMSVDEITDSFARSSAEGGKYFKSMEKQSKTLNGQISTLKDNFSSLAGTLANDVSGQIGGSILPEINQLIADMEVAFTEGGIPKMLEVMSTGITQMLVGLVEQLPQFIEVGTQIIHSMINGISTNKETLINSIIEAITELLYAGIDMLPQLLELGMSIILQLILGLAEKAPDLVPQIISAIILMLDTFNDHFDDFLLAGVQLILGLIEGLIKSIPDIITNLPTILIAILNFFTAKKLVSAGITLLKGLGTGLINGIPNLIKNIPQIISNMINAFKTNGISAFKDIGKNLIQGLWEGIKNVKNWLMDKISGFFGGVVDSIKDFFGIHSPSKLFFEIGGYIDKGFIKGIESMSDDVNDQIDSTFGSGLDYLYNGYSNFASGLPDASYSNVPTQTIYLNNSNTNSSILQVDGRVLAETVNNYNSEKEVAV